MDKTVNINHNKYPRVEDVMRIPGGWTKHEDGIHKTYHKDEGWMEDAPCGDVTHLTEITSHNLGGYLISTEGIHIVYFSHNDLLPYHFIKEVIMDWSGVERHVLTVHKRLKVQP